MVWGYFISQKLVILIVLAGRNRMLSLCAWHGIPQLASQLVFLAIIARLQQHPMDLLSS